MIPKAFDQITEQELQGLVNNGVLEGKTIEYKQEMTINKDSDKKEFLADVSSFANAGGGDLIYGIVEDRSTSAPEIVIEDSEIDVEKILKPWFDMVWNACVFSRSLNFDDSGKWTGRL